ncbi:MAG: DUF4139 domain-containing protein [Candidatus Symbiothrix sp.]|jgi:uncharacterized protein (TIGR02231 family)|nr:DUF4139 domain-containing protein [Candidatus Symbiothrix sp.]
MKTKRFYFIVFGSLLLSLPTMAQTEKSISSKATEATVFFKGAELIHTANALLTRGENEIRIEGIAASIDVNSLKIKTTDNVIVSSYEYSIDRRTTKKTPDSVLKNMDDSIKACEKALDKINVSMKINSATLKQLQEGVTKSISDSEKGLPIDELIKTVDFYKSKSEQIETQQLSLTEQKIQLEENVRRLKNQLNKKEADEEKISGVLKLTLVSPSSVNCTFTISYYTSAASWTPYFDVNVASTDKPIVFVQKSKVRQTTGLDWEKVKLTFSTSTPSNGKEISLFSAWFLEQQHLRMADVAAEVAQNSVSYSDMNATAIYGARASNGVILVTTKNEISDYVTESDNAFNITYTIDLPYTLLGSGKEQSIELQTKTAEAEYKYYCAPKLDGETYLLAEIPDWEQLGLISGKANITYDGTYVGATSINAASTQSKLALTLGTDKRLSVKREKLMDYSSTKFLGNDVLQVFSYKLTVRNNQNKKVNIVLKDQYPISTQKNIEVKLLKETTSWTANKEDVGVITWEETLAPGETKTYQISYSVKYPKEMRLNL